MFKSTRAYSVIFNRCPRCHQGSFFKYSNPFRFPGFSEMNDKCSVCGEDFIREGGFYYGAMYASYAITVALGVAEFIILKTIFGFTEYVFLAVFTLSALVLWPLIYRMARLLWLNLFVSYKKELKDLHHH